MSPERLVSRISRDDLQSIVTLLEMCPCAWFVAGGWAIDLFLGRVTREQEDLEICIARQDQAHLHALLTGWHLYKIVRRELVPWRHGEWLEPPIHQIVARQEHPKPWEFEFFLNDVSDGQWLFRRDPRIRRPVDEVYLQTEQGIPTSAPDIQLLFKSTWHQPKDEHDFHTVLGRLHRAQRSWLQHALEVYRPGDPWLDDLARGS